MSHSCHSPGCTREVPPRMFMCRAHWFALPKRLQDAIWREYRRGQEISKSPSNRYMAVQQLACAHSVFKPSDEAAVRAALPYIAGAAAFRKRAIAEGVGDPLEGLVTDFDALLEAEQPKSTKRRIKSR